MPRGTVPVDEGRYAPAQQSAPPQAAPPPGGDYEIDSRTLMEHAAPAVKAGVDGLAKIFGIGQQQGGIATEEDQVRHEQGVQRFARGEGAATPEEIQGIDQKLGMDTIDADPGMKNLMRIDQVATYYLMRGEKDKAEAASAALLQYGAMQVKQSAVLAQVAFENWQETGDPNALRHASQAIQRAHQFIPDGTNLKIDIDPKTRQIVATTVGADGKSQQQVIDPQAVPALLGQAMDGSAYWKSVYQVGQPRLAEQEISQQGQNQRAADTRTYEDYKNERKAQEEQYRHERDITEGKSAGERQSHQDQAWFDDWKERRASASAEERPALIREGLKYRFDRAPDRRTPVNNDELTWGVNSQFKDTIDDPADVNAVRGLAQVIAQKNPSLDAGSAMEAAGALVTAPSLPNTDDGRLSVGGLNLVFNPDLLPQLSLLRKKYKVAQ